MPFDVILKIFYGYDISMISITVTITVFYNSKLCHIPCTLGLRSVHLSIRMPDFSTNNIIVSYITQDMLSFKQIYSNEYLIKIRKLQKWDQTTFVMCHYPVLKSAQNILGIFKKIVMKHIAPY